MEEVHGMQVGEIGECFKSFFIAQASAGKCQEITSNQLIYANENRKF